MKGNGIRFNLNYWEEKKDVRMVIICIQKTNKGIYYFF